MEPAEHPQDRAPAHVHSDELPPWLAPGVNPVPPGPLSRPAVAWGGTLTATALMVAFGLWLGDVPAPPPVAAVSPAPMLADERPVPEVPPMVLAESGSAVTAPAPAAAPQPVSVIKRPAVVRHRTALSSFRPAARVRTRAMAQPVSRSRMAAINSGEGQRIRCKHGELARECLARYRKT